jgi:hypothetical protein
MTSKQVGVERSCTTDAAVASSLRPGLNRRRLVALMQSAIARCELELSGLTVVTEAANGPYVVTPLLAAMAGARRVYAIARDSHYGTALECGDGVLQLSDLAGVTSRVEIVYHKTPELFAEADIVTNSGHVRPIDVEVVSWLPPSAVVSLMYEAWEFREEDVDLTACEKKGIVVGATNECHPAIDVFSFLGPMAVRLLRDADVAGCGSKLLFLCDNPFGPYILPTLRAIGAVVDLSADAAHVNVDTGYQAVLVVLRPRRRPAVGGRESALSAEAISRRWPGAVVVQFWGDIDRDALRAAGVPFWPVESPGIGHMGILPSALGPEPIVRLQSGGLKVGQVLARGYDKSRPSDREYVQFVQRH